MKLNDLITINIISILFSQCLWSQNVISYGSNITSELTTVGEIDTFWFNGQINDILTFRASYSNSDFDIKIEIFNPTGALIASEVGPNGYARINSITLGVTGSYKIIIKDNENNFSGGIYGISLQKLNIPSLPTIGYNTNQSFTGIALAEIKAFNFSGQDGDMLIYRLASSNFSFSARMEIYSQSGVLVSSSYNGGVAYLRDSVTLDENGTYTVLVMHNTGTYANATLAYGIYILKLNTPNLPTLAYNTNQPFTGLALAEIKAFNFSGQDGDMLIYRLASSNFSFSARMEIYSQSGALVSSSYNGGVAYLRDSVTLDENGTYTLLVMHNTGTYANATLAYGIYILKLNTPNLPTLAYNTNQSFTGLALAEIKAFNFSGQDGDMLIYRLASSDFSFSARMEIYSQAGVLVSSSYNGGISYLRDSVTLDENGTYTVVVMHNTGTYANTTLAYGIYILKLNTPNLPTLAYNTNQPFTGIARAEIKAFNFSGQDSDMLIYRLAASDFFFSARMEIYSQAGVLVSSSYNGGSAYLRDSVTLDENGTYTLLVMHNSGTYANATLAYGIYILKLNTPNLPTLAYNTNQSFTGIALAEIKAFNFSGQDGDLLIYRLASSDFSFSARMEIYSQAGVLVSSSYNAGISYLRDSVILDENGTYTLLVMHNTGTYANATLAYGVALQRTFNAPNATPLIGVISSNFDKYGQMTAYTIQGNQGDTVNLYMSTDFSSIEPHLELYDLNGDLLGINMSNTTANLSNIILPDTGTFVLLAMDETGTWIGNYEIGILGVITQILPLNEWIPFQIGDGVLFNGKVLIPHSGNLFALVKKGNQIGYAGTWNGDITVKRDGTVLASDGGNEDFELHLPNAQSGLYDIFISTSQVGEGFVRFSTALDTLNLNEWKTGEILRPYGLDWQQIEVPPGQDTLYLQTEGYGLWSTLDVYYNHLGNNQDHWQFSNYGEGYHIEGKIPSPKPGRYYLRYKDSAVLQGSPSQVRKYLINANSEPTGSPPSEIPVITGLSTYTVGQGPVTLEIYGYGLSRIESVRLNRTGNSSIEGSILKAANNGIIKVKFNLTDAQIGDWTLTGIFDLNLEVLSERLLTINQSENANIQISLLGNNYIRMGRKHKVILKYANTGNVDATNVLVYLDMPENYFDSIDLPWLTDYRTSLLWAKRRINYILIPSIPQATSGEFSFSIKTSSSDSFQIKAGLVDYPEEWKDSNSNFTIYPNLNFTIYPNLNIERFNFGEPQNGELVFQEFSIFGHTGIFVNEGTCGTQGGCVIEYRSDSKIYNTPFNEFKTRNNNKPLSGNAFDGDTYLGSGHPPSWTPGIGNLIASKALELYNSNPEIKWNQYFLIPTESNQNNCLSFAGLIYSQSGLPLNLNPFSSPLFKFLEFGGQLPNEKEYIGYDLAWIFTHLGEESLWNSFDHLIADALKLAATYWGFPVGSLTPEDKYGLPGFDSVGTPMEFLKRYVNQNAIPNYKIDFWNSETATAPAQEVFIVDTLDRDFDLKTFHFEKLGFLRWTIDLEGGQYFDLNVDMRPDNNIIVNVKGVLDTIDRTVNYIFKSLDPITLELPDDPFTGFLPPIDSNGYNLGWVEYSLQPQTGLPTNTQLTNQAFVNFDGVGPWNPAPTAAPWLNTLDIASPESKIVPLTSSVNTNKIILSVIGDDKNGSGIKDYTIFVSENNGPYSPWKISAIGKTDTLIGVIGSSYSLYSIANDNVGNVEDPKENPDTVITITGCNVNDSEFKVVTKAILGGTYFTSGDTMSTSLRTQNLLPSKCPYDTSIMLNTIPINMVDWVRIDLVDTINGDTTYASQCGCLLKNGLIQAISGDSLFTFCLALKPYFSLRIRHRNHLSVRSRGLVVVPGSTMSFDFRAGNNLYIDPTITSSSFHNVGLPEMPTASGRYALWPGDVNGDGQVKYQGSANDRGLILSAVGGTVITNTVSGYHPADVTLNGQVKYQGGGNDRGVVLSSIGGSVITKVSKAHD